MSSELVRARPGADAITPAASPAALSVAPDVWMSPGLSNSYCVATTEGRVVINTGMGFEAGHHKRLYDDAAPMPTRYLLLTQGHVDHVGGVDHFREHGTVLVAQRNSLACQADDERIHRFRVKRSMPYWAEAVSKADRFVKRQPADDPIPAQSVAVPDVTFDDRYEFDLGDVRFELLSIPGGETIDSTCVWLPARGIAFVGNAFSALFGHVPNLVTLRADRLRFALPFIESVQRVIDLEAELLCVGHFAPIEGRATVRRELERVRDGVQWLHDTVVAGMNDGKSVIELMRDVTMPAGLSLGEGYGKVSWDVRAIWEGYAGWFHARSTTELYPIEPTAVSRELVELAGGAVPVVAAARRRLAAGDAIGAVALLEHAQAADSSDAGVLAAFVEAHEILLVQHETEHLDDFANFWLVGWIRHQIHTARQQIRESPA